MSVLPTPLISSSPDRLGGTPVFSGTRVPVQGLIDYLRVSRPQSTPPSPQNAPRPGRAHNRASRA
ncbi:MAG: hypothetical protein C0516_09545 [Gemmatimonas sp.]|nr:hypothetical protein [Gemmatimonas sp.]